ncbi:N-methyltryptophan oxidase [Rhodococcoides trifolii]|uniref:N-methyltryptophan oxidase n=1 Tax=Rhodococcoides trifolii TaxID=908250 RepID=A0A917FP53_9NOCA|nr:FAD-dependent oxidoreductase [Rhodococcus trifolii]GGF94140.1 N-methyltryptophan oxidase [Rhodococcus trifolii]
MRVVVIGGGVIGAASAWRLALRGIDVILLEQFGTGHTRGASHGSSRIFRHAYDNDVYTELAVHAGRLWDELDAASGAEPVLTRTGAVDHGPSAVIAARAASLARVGRPFDIVAPAAAERRWPGMRFDTSVLHNPDAGRLHADRAVASLLARAQENGADVLHDNPVHDIKLLSDGVEVVTRSGAHRADAVVSAAGAWTPELASGLPDIALPELRTTQEQPAHFAPIDESLTWPSFVHHPGGALNEADHAGGIYGLSSEHGIKVGEHATGPEVIPSSRSFVADPAGEERLRAYASRWLPGVDSGSAASVTCLYTCSPDHNFVVDRRGRVTIAAGFSGHGFKFAPAVGEYVTDLVTGVSTVPVGGLSTLFGLGGRVR